MKTVYLKKRILEGMTFAIKKKLLHPYSLYGFILHVLKKHESEKIINSPPIRFSKTNLNRFSDIEMYEEKYKKALLTFFVDHASLRLFDRTGYIEIQYNYSKVVGKLKDTNSNKRKLKEKIKSNGWKLAIVRNRKGVINE